MKPKPANDIQHNHHHDTEIYRYDERMVCHSCDAIMEPVELSKKQQLKCAGCGSTVAVYKSRSLTVYMAWLLTAMTFCGLSFVLPFLSFKVQGITQTISLAMLFTQFWLREEYMFSMLISLLLLWAPLLHIVSLMVVVLSIRFKSNLLGPKDWFKLATKIKQWNMIDVYLFGILVTFVKLAGMGTIIFNYAFATYVIWVFLHIYVNIMIDEKWIWKKLYEQS